MHNFLLETHHLRPSSGTGTPHTLKAKGGMENGDSEPEQQDQRPAR